jgi:hypothetical protein
MNCSNIYKLHIDEKYKSVYRPNLRILGIWAQYNIDSNLTHKDEYLEKQNASTFPRQYKDIQQHSTTIVG